MTVAELIARATKRLVEADPQLLGVRICPISLAPEDAEALRKEIQANLGQKAFVAISIPGAKRTESARLFVSADQSAAERATLWRNQVNIESGEHLVYASVQVHGKAGGLKDCLTPLHDSDLRAEFASWCDEKGSGLPNGFGGALRDSGILGRASAKSLCEFSAAVQRDKRDNRWEACGHHLPLLNLARDTGLRPSNAAARLEENERVVSRAATGERAAGVTTGPTAQLREAFRAAADDVTGRLRRIDLTEHLAVALDRKKAPKREKKMQKAAEQSKVIRGKKAGRLAQNPTAVLVEAAQGASKDRLIEIERRAKKLEQDVATTPTPARGGGSAGADDGVDAVWSRAQQASEFGALAERVPFGLGAMLLRSLRGDGYGLRWTARESASALLTDLPPQVAPIELRGKISDAGLADALSRVVALRRAAADLLLVDADRNLKGLSTFISAPLVALADRGIRGAVTGLLDATTALYRIAAVSPDGPGRSTVLSLDTVEVRAKSGDAVLVIGPLHPLWLSQALGRFDALLTQSNLSATAKRLLVRSLSEAPAAPEHWPSDAGPSLQLNRPIGGLIAYQSTAGDLDPDDVEETAAQVIGIFLRSLPHARHGLRIAVLGGDPGPVIDGAARALEEHPELVRVTVHHRGARQGNASECAERGIADGRLSVGALPATGDAIGPELKPHIVFRLAPASAPGISLQPAAPVQPGLGAGSGLLPTEFTVVESGLRARTPIDCARFPALAAFEAVHALSSSGQPQGAFARNAWAVSLRALLADSESPSVSWDVVLAPRIGRRAPEQRFLLAHERATDQLSVAIVSRDIAPAARALRDAFRSVGVEDLRPLVLNKLAIHLASVTSQGIVSPQRGGDQVLAGSVIGMALRKEMSGAETFVAYLEGGTATTLLGQALPSLPGAFAVAFGAHGDKLRLVLGYAALGNSVEADIVRGQLTGTLQELFSRLASTVELATTGEGVGSVAAREALNWLLWPALAAAEQPASKTERLLLSLDRGVPTDVSAIAYLPPSSAVLKRPPGAKLGKYALNLRSLDVSSFEALVFGSGKAR